MSPSVYRVDAKKTNKVFQVKILHIAFETDLAVVANNRMDIVHSASP